jgi:glucoamylase
MAGAGGHGSFFPCFVRLRRGRATAGPTCRQFSNGLGVRSRPRRQHRTHGRIGLTGTREFTLGLAFGNSQHHAVSTLFQSLSTPFAEHRKRYAEQWARSSAGILPLEKASGDGGNLYRASFSLLRAHEDKSYPGAFIASLAIPWGEAVGDEDQGGYHLVWTRDMVNSANAMLAAGDRATPLRALIYLDVSQQESGGFAQNFWIDGEPYWRGIQLDEVAFPILLAWRLKRENALQDFDPYPMVLRAAAYLVRHGPVTPQERWEEVSGYSPSTLASNIAALICAACFARERGDEATAKYLEEYADFLECHVESWTVTTEGTLLPGVARHYMRILPERADNPTPRKIRTRETSPLRTASPARRTSFQPKKSWMPVFWNWCVMESAGPTIRSLWIPSRSWTRC